MVIESLYMSLIYAGASDSTSSGEVKDLANQLLVYFKQSFQPNVTNNNSKGELFKGMDPMILFQYVKVVGKVCAHIYFTNCVDYQLFWKNMEDGSL